MIADETRLLRGRSSGSASTLDRLDRPTPGGGAKFLGKVVSASSGASLLADHYVLVNPTSVGGEESEGSGAFFTPNPSVTIPGVVLGSIPATGDLLVFSSVDGRWVARKSGAGGGGTHGVGDIPDCFCQGIPSPLSMVSFDETCNFGMFRTCTLEWVPTPAWAASLLLPPNIYLSTESFPDPISGGAEFFHYLTCHFAQFTLTRLYPTSPFGSPFRDGILYTWQLGDFRVPNGNACNPFQLDNGTAFPGSDPTCRVTIDPT